MMTHHGYPAWHSSGGDIEGHVAQHDKESGGHEGLHDVVANVPPQTDLHDYPRVADVVDIGAVVVVEVNGVVELVQSYIRIYLEILVFYLITTISPVTWDMDLLSHLMLIWLLE